MNDFKNLNVLVTGATGFIGSNLVRSLLQKEASVSIIKRPSSMTWRLKDILTRIKVLEADLRDKHQLELVLKHSNHQIIFHIAACIKRHRSTSVIKENLETNVWGTVNLINCVKEKNIRSFVNTGTCAEYGNNPVPFHETQRENPLSPYAASKVASSHYCQMITKTTGFPIITLRPFLTYGPYQTGEMLIPSVINNCLRSLPIRITKAKQTREFYYISDMIDGFILAATNKKAIGEIIDLGTGREYTVKETVEMIARLTGYPLKSKLENLSNRENEVLRSCCRGEKAKKILGWRPKVSLEDGLIKTIEWQRKFLKV